LPEAPGHACFDSRLAPDAKGKREKGGRPALLAKKLYKILTQPL